VAVARLTKSENVSAFRGFAALAARKISLPTPSSAEFDVVFGWPKRGRRFQFCIERFQSVRRLFLQLSQIASCLSKPCEPCSRVIRCCRFEAAEPLPFPRPESIFSSHCGAISGRLGFAVGRRSFQTVVLHTGLVYPPPVDQNRASRSSRKNSITQIVFFRRRIPRSCDVAIALRSASPLPFLTGRAGGGALQA
jgi:hypothetical protein